MRSVLLSAFAGIAASLLVILTYVIVDMFRVVS